MLRLITIAVIALFTAAPLAAQTEPRFLIERIDVRNSTRSAEIVRAESRLEEGQSYTERELREASYRINRLPFVYDSTYSLEKGSRRDAYVFVVTITATRPFFYDAEVDVTTNQYDREYGSLSAIAGGRTFVGRRGVAHVAVGHNDDLGGDLRGLRSVEAGYTQYDLFGTRAFATLNVAAPFAGHNRFDPSPSVLLGVPISRNQTVTARFGGQSGSSGSEDTPVQSQYRSRHGELAWTYNSTDHPFFPAQGVLLSASLRRQTNSQQIRYPSPATPFETMTYEARFDSLTLTGTKYWRLSDRHSTWGRFEEFFARYHSESRDVISFGSGELHHQERLTVGFTRNLRQRSSRGAESWAEATYQLAHYPQPEGELPPGVYFDNFRSRVGVSWVRRTAIGRLHLGVGYEW